MSPTVFHVFNAFAPPRWPGKGWNMVLCLYTLLQPRFDKTWKPWRHRRG